MPELLLWLRAPALALDGARRLQADPTLRSVSVQRQALEIEVQALQQILMLAWGLATHLTRISGEADHGTHQSANVKLAIRVARHSEAG